VKFDLYTDPGHGWLKVHMQLLAKLGIAEKITGYSYMRGEFAYLEEDCDLTTFCKAMEAQGETVEFRYHIADNPSIIRRYEGYTPTQLKAAVIKTPDEENISCGRCGRKDLPLFPNYVCPNCATEEELKKYA
jgi:hypothetical protein